MGHDTATPSLTFHRQKNTWKCFGACGKYGDAIGLVMELEKIDFKAALEWFNRNYGINVSNQYGKLSKHRKVSMPKKIIGAVSSKNLSKQEFAADPEIYEWFINKCAGVSSLTGLEYLDKHGISKETATLFKLRELRDPDYALRKLISVWGESRVYRSGIAWGRDGHPTRLVWDSYAILFPFSEQGLITYIQARMFEGNKKFLNPRGVIKPLFNSDRLRITRAGKLIHMCEGVPDTLALESKGVAAVGVLGATSFRVEWVDRFSKYSVVILGDGDKAGAKFAKDISSFFMERGKAVQCMQLPEGKDVADVLTGSRKGA